MKINQNKIPVILLIVVGAVGILLFLSGTFFSGNDRKSEDNKKTQEAELASFIQCSPGVGKAEVRLCIDHQGKVTSVAVICAGGDKPEVVAAVTQLLSKTLGIGTNRIYVSKLDKSYLNEG